jgi:asparagine synthase (glutamine-hydrolysing)
MVSAESGNVIVFNGEIFNHLELREDLESRGYRFRTRSDTEVILHMYEELGEACVDTFNGQWAFCIWDRQRRQFFLSRDRLGIRPLFFARQAESFVFASEIKSLLIHPELSATVDLEALDDIFTLWTTAPPRTFFRNIDELPPGHNLVVDADANLRQKPYWQLDYPKPDAERSERQLIEELGHLLKDSVRLRLRSDVPVGAYLSGGLDSTLTVALVRQHTDTPIETFSISFADAEYDESRYQKAAVDLLAVESSSVHCTGEEIRRIFPRVVWHAEMPMIRAAPAPLCLLSQMVNERGYKVVLTGEGADEVFGGYDIFKEAKIRRFWGAQPHSKMRPLLLKRLYPYMPALQAQSLDYLKAFFNVRPEDLENPFFSHLPRWHLTASVKRFFSGDVKAALAGRNIYDILAAELPSEFHHWHTFCQAQYLETRYLLPGYILSTQGDRMAMANSVEGRFPFLDHRVVEFAARLPPHLKMRALDEKYLLKRVASGMIPEVIIARPKQPYRAPDVPSLVPAGSRETQHAHLTELLSDEAIRDVGLFEPRMVSGLLRKCRQGKPMSVKDSMTLVGILSSQLAVQQFVHCRWRPDHD